MLRIGFRPGLAFHTALAVVGVLLLGSGAQADPRHHPIPGGVAVIALDEVPNEARYQDDPVMVRSDDERGVRAIVGIPLSAEPGTHHLLLDGERRAFKVRAYEYEASRIEIDEEHLVTPPEDELERIRDEQRRIRTAYRSRAVDRDPRLDLAIPVPESRPTSRFGLRRYINDQPRNPHNGLDLAAPTGTPVHAAEGGQVVESGHFYFNGKTVLVDHGNGLVSMYCHLDTMDVETGDTVARGEQIGTVGKTGRVTGAHLHWTVTLNGQAVDPELFLAAPVEALTDGGE